MSNLKINVHFSSKTNEWTTPIDFYNKLNNEFNFTLDPCCTKDNAKCKKFYTKDDDGELTVGNTTVYPRSVVKKIEVLK